MLLFPCGDETGTMVRTRLAIAQAVGAHLGALLEGTGMVVVKLLGGPGAVSGYGSKPSSASPQLTQKFATIHDVSPLT
jgi:hypothetical protein